MATNTDPHGGSAAFISPAPPPVEIREPRGGLKPTKPVKTQTTGPR